MDRYKLRIRRRRDSGFPFKRDTPVKPGLRRREKNRRLLPCKHYDPLPEEPEVDDMNDPSVKPASLVCGGTAPVHCESVSHLSDPAFAENPRNQTASFVTPAKTESYHRKVSQAGYLTVQVTPVLEALKDGDTPESGTSRSMEPDTTFCSEEAEDNGLCYSSTSTTLSSIPSPEIFRKDSDAVSQTFPNKEELMSLHLHKKNSTLLDVSHAKSIQMHHPPNLSAIIVDNASNVLSEKSCGISHHKNPESDSKMQNDSFESDKDLKRKTQSKLSERKAILCRKRVWFRSPAAVETLKAKHIPSSTGELSSPKQVKPDVETSELGEISFREDILPMTVMLKRPVKASPVKAKFFDFGSDSERDAYFQRMTERCAKLKSAVFIPFKLCTR